MQFLLGIESESEIATREKMPVNSGQNNLLHEVGILLGERMVKLVEYHVLLNTKPAEALRILSDLQRQIDKVNIAISKCQEITSQGPVPILTERQREYIELHKGEVQIDSDKAVLNTGLKRAVINAMSEDKQTEHSIINEHTSTQEVTKNMEELLLLA